MIQTKIATRTERANFDNPTLNHTIETTNGTYQEPMEEKRGLRLDCILEEIKNGKGFNF